ncbi:unnamed protein product [Ectocarpus fasciculatus]
MQSTAPEQTRRDQVSDDNHTIGYNGHRVQAPPENLLVHGRSILSLSPPMSRTGALHHRRKIGASTEIVVWRNFAHHHHQERTFQRLQKEEITGRQNFSHKSPSSHLDHVLGLWTCLYVWRPSCGHHTKQAGPITLPQRHSHEADSPMIE